MSEEIIKIAEERIQVLRTLATQIADAFYEHHYAGNAARTDQRSKRSQLGVRVRAKASPSLEIVWVRYRWVPKRGADGEGFKLFSEYLRKGRGHRYSQGVLSRYAQDWEADLVQECEDKFAAIRAEYAALRKTIVQAKYALLARNDVLALTNAVDIKAAVGEN